MSLSSSGSNILLVDCYFYPTDEQNTVLFVNKQCFLSTNVDGVTAQQVNNVANRLSRLFGNSVPNKTALSVLCDIDSCWSDFTALFVDSGYLAQLGDSASICTYQEYVSKTDIIVKQVMKENGCLSGEWSEDDIEYDLFDEVVSPFSLEEDRLHIPNRLIQYHDSDIVSGSIIKAYITDLKHAVAVSTTDAFRSFCLERADLMAIEAQN